MNVYLGANTLCWCTDPGQLLVGLRQIGCRLIGASGYDAGSLELTVTCLGPSGN